MILSPSQLFLGIVSLATLLGIIQWLLAIWIKKRLEASIQHEYAKKLEDYKFSQLQRQKAEVIASLFSEWAKYYGKEADILNDEELIDYWKRLNEMSMQISLWIPDAKLLKEIMSRLQNKEGAKDVRMLMGDIRKLILNDGKDPFEFKEITTWPKDGGENPVFKKLKTR